MTRLILAATLGVVAVAGFAQAGTANHPVTIAHREQIGDPPWTARYSRLGLLASFTGHDNEHEPPPPPPPPPQAAVSRPTTEEPIVAPKSVTTVPLALNAPTTTARVVTQSSLGGVWACIRQHESGGNYATNTGNGYYGAYQFALATWQSLGGTGLPSAASPAVQDAMAQKLQARSGWGQWPQTSKMCGV